MNQNIQGSPVLSPSRPLHGVLPNGETLLWNLLGLDDISDLLALQEAVSSAATDHEKVFLIKREAGDFSSSMTLGHLYWGGWANGQLVAAFGMAENDEEIGDGRGEATPLDVLGVTQHNEVDILKAAQVHPNYRDQGLAVLGAWSRYTHFVNDPDKKVLMTKTHDDNQKIKDNYRANGFTEIYRCPVTDRGETFDLVTFMARRDLIEGWLARKENSIVEKYQLSVQ